MSEKFDMNNHETWELSPMEETAQLTEFSQPDLAPIEVAGVMNASSAAESISSDELATAHEEASLINSAVSDGRIKNIEKLEASENLDAVIAKLKEQDAGNKATTERMPVAEPARVETVVTPAASIIEKKDIAEGETNSVEQNISPEEQKNIEKLEYVETKKSQDAFEYVALSEDEWGGGRTKNLSLDDPLGFGIALDMKKMANKRSEKKIITGGMLGGAAGITGGMLAAAAQAGGALSTAAILGPLSISGAIFLVAPAAIGVGAVGWLGKKGYDVYQERKAKKSFNTARDAKIARTSLLGKFWKKN